MKIIWLVPYLCLVSSLYVGCAPTGPAYDPTAQLQATTRTYTWLTERYGLVTEPHLVQMNSRITTQLENVVPFVAKHWQLRLAETPNFKVYVLDADEPNAFSAGAGFIFITRGLMRSLKSEAALAAVISHEMAHELLGHNHEAFKRAASDAKTPQYSFSLDQELEADSLSIRLLYVSHYDVKHAVHALSMIYRPDTQIVSQVNTDWFDKRASHLSKSIAALGPHLPGTETTREFRRVQRYYW